MLKNIMFCEKRDFIFFPDSPMILLVSLTFTGVLLRVCRAFERLVARGRQVVSLPFLVGQFVDGHILTRNVA